MATNGFHKILINGGWIITAIGLFYYALLQKDWNLAWKWGLVGGVIQGAGLVTFIRKWRFGK